MKIYISVGASPITFIEGDTIAEHVFIDALTPGKLWSTGVGPLWTYGQVDAGKYLKGRHYFTAEPVVPLTLEQIMGIEATNRAMNGQPYGFWKYEALEWIHARQGLVPTLNKKPDPMQIIKNPICSQAVGSCLWRAGVPIGKREGKLDASAILPSTILNEAQDGILLKITAEIKP